MWLDFGSLVCMPFPKVRLGTAISILMGGTFPPATLSEKAVGKRGKEVSPTLLLLLLLFLLPSLSACSPGSTFNSNFLLSIRWLLAVSPRAI